MTPAPDGRGREHQSPARVPAPGPPSRRWLVPAAIVAALIVNFALASGALTPAGRVAIPYTPTFLNQLMQGNVTSISSQGSTIQGDLKAAVTYPPKGNDATRSSRFSTEVPAFADTKALSALVRAHGVTVNARPIDNGRLLGSVLLGFLPTIVIFGLIFFFVRRAMAGGGLGGGGIGGLGRSRARRAESKDVHVTFEDVAGIDDAKADLAEIVDFLRDPARYGRLGGRIPRGLLLSGAPGTGKTLLARAVAGQAGVPFFQLSASEFIEMIVGVGASRVRDLFSQAKQAAPAIIFIDELDAIGRKRGGNSFGGSNDEREQTLNQILTEMDGFDPTAGVIVIAATNRPEILDPALLRPGRFDRRVNVSAPDKVGRREIFEVHTRDIPLGDDVDLGAIGSSTPGMVGADIANVCNEAALTAARRDGDTVNHADFTNALERILLGAERKVLMSHEDKRRTAYHEGGHAIVGMLTVRKVSIIPRGQSLGVTFSAPEADQFNYARQYLLARIRVALGGRVAEELVFGDITTGAESDIEQLTQIARQMVGRWGMSEVIGPIAVIAHEDQGPLWPGASETSQDTQREVDDEVRRIVAEARHDVTALLTEHRPQLDALVEALLEHETLDEADAYLAARAQRTPSKAADAMAYTRDRTDPGPGEAHSTARPSRTPSGDANREQGR